MLQLSKTTPFCGLNFILLIMLISETLKYTINPTKLIIHNVTVEDEGEYACYSEEIAIVYTIIDTIVTCKYILSAYLLYQYACFRESRVNC